MILFVCLQVSVCVYVILIRALAGCCFFFLWPSLFVADVVVVAWVIWAHVYPKIELGWIEDRLAGVVHCVCDHQDERKKKKAAENYKQTEKH